MPKNFVALFNFFQFPSYFFRCSVVLLMSSLLCVSCSGKSTGQRLNDLETAGSESKERIDSIEDRLNGLQARTEALTTEMRRVGSAKLEVLSKSGKKIGETTQLAPESRMPAPSLPPTGTSAPSPVPMNSLPTPPVTPEKTIPLDPTNRVVTPVAANDKAESAPPSVKGNSSPVLTLPPIDVKAPIDNAEKLSAQSSASATAATKAASIPSVTSGTTDVLSLPPETGGTQGQPKNIPVSTGQKNGSLAKPVASSPPPSAPLPASAKGEEESYKAALALVNSGKPTEARDKFNTFLQTYPSGRYAANALYWIGETYYAQQNYSEAVLQFKQVGTEFPRHHKNADALLRAGMTYQKMGDKDNAALQYKALLADFPTSEAAQIARNKGWGK